MWCDLKCAHESSAIIFYELLEGKFIKCVRNFTYRHHHVGKKSNNTTVVHKSF
jgi:hypothetical protein